MGMTKGERQDLQRLARMRGNVAKKDLEARAAELLAQMEAQLARKFDADHELWQKAVALAEQKVQEANAEIDRVCNEELHVPEKFRPELTLKWYDRGENAITSRRVELRRVGQTRIDANLKDARAKVDREVVRISTELIADGLDSEQARLFLASMPAIEDLMPQLTMQQLEADAEKEQQRQLMVAASRRY